MSSQRRRPINIEVNVNLGTQINVETYCLVLFDILKYILYQRHQIPLPYDALHSAYLSSESALSKVDDRAVGKNCQKKNGYSTSEFISVQVGQLRKEADRKREEKRKQHWIKKVSKVIESVQDAMSIVKKELLNGHVGLVAFVIGNTAFSAREVFYVHPHIDLVQSCFDLAKPDLKIKQHIFRTFVTNEELFSFVKKSAGQAKVWILLEKSLTSFTQDSLCQPGLIPRPNLRIPDKVRSVSINLLQRIFIQSASMELTPCVSSAQLKTLLPTKGRYDQNNGSHDHDGSFDEDDFLPLSACGVASLDSGLTALRPGSHFNNMAPSRRSSHEFGDSASTPHWSKFQRDIIETPVVSSQIYVLPTSPIHYLSRKMLDFNLNSSIHDVGQETFWFQVERPILGLQRLMQ